MRTGGPAAAMCSVCGYQVWPQPPDNKLCNKNGDANCEAPFWVVQNARGVAVSTFVGEHKKHSPEERAKAFAKTKPGYVAVQISPHSHQVK